MAKRVAGEKMRFRRPAEGAGSARRAGGEKRTRPGARHEGRSPIEGSGYPTHRRLLTADEVMFVSPFTPMSVAPAALDRVAAVRLPPGERVEGLPRVALLRH